MTEPQNRDQQVIFAFSRAEDNKDGVPTLVFLMPQAAWDYAVNGLGHDFDLRKVGIDLKVIIGRTETHETGMAMLKTSGALREDTQDMRETSVAFKPKRKAKK